MIELLDNERLDTTTETPDNKLWPIYEIINGICKSKYSKMWEYSNLLSFILHK